MRKLSLRSLALVLTVAMALSLSLYACSNDTSDTVTAPTLNKPDNSLLTIDNPQVRRVMEVQDRHTPDIMAVPGVVGTSTSTDAGDIVMKVYLESEIPAGKLPAQIEGVRVVQQVTGELIARKGPPPMDGGDGGDDPKAKQTPPVKMGTSGGWEYDLANGYCCGGTLGSLIQSGSTKYVLSNYHVLYADTTPGGNGRTAQAGDPVIQPALIDVGCQASNSQAIASLVNNGGSLPQANIDAGIAAVMPGMVDETGAILSIGTISSATIGNPSVGLAVKKMGRTTGLGRADVDGLNATVSIGYTEECAGGSDFTKTFTGQIVFTNDRCKFLDGGDSGSLCVEDVDTNPRAVALLFAGSSQCRKGSVAIGNPINEVLSHYNATMVGN